MKRGDPRSDYENAKTVDFGYSNGPSFPKKHRGKAKPKESKVGPSQEIASKGELFRISFKDAGFWKDCCKFLSSVSDQHNVSIIRDEGMAITTMTE